MLTKAENQGFGIVGVRYWSNCPLCKKEKANGSLGCPLFSVMLD
jgi:hypothetical protein